MNESWPSSGPDMPPGPDMFPGPGTFPGPGPRRGGGQRVGGIAGVIILVVGIVVAIIVVATVHSETHVNPAGPCVGGPQMGASGQPVGHGNYRFPCEDGGSTVVHIGN